MFKLAVCVVVLLVGANAQIARLLSGNSGIRTIDASQLESLGLGGIRSQLGNLGGNGQGIILLLQGGGAVQPAVNNVRTVSVAQPAISTITTRRNPVSSVSTNTFSSSSSSSDSDDQGGPPSPYSFNYDTDDEAGTTTRREESGDESGTVRGSYSYQDAEGVFRRVEYTADATGFHATVKTNEPGTGKNEEIGDPADTTFEVEQPPAGLVERYTNAAAAGFSAPPANIPRSAPRPQAAASNSFTSTNTRTTSSGAGGQAFQLIPVSGGSGGLGGLSSGSLGGLGGNIILLRTGIRK